MILPNAFLTPLMGQRFSTTSKAKIWSALICKCLCILWRLLLDFAAFSCICGRLTLDSAAFSIESAGSQHFLSDFFQIWPKIKILSQDLIETWQVLAFVALPHKYLYDLPISLQWLRKKWNGFELGEVQGKCTSPLQYPPPHFLNTNACFHYFMIKSRGLELWEVQWKCTNCFQYTPPPNFMNAHTCFKYFVRKSTGLKL